MDQEEAKGINFDLPKNRSNVIKVIGVGGGGSNAINYMFQQGIKGVDFVITNTDAQALSESGVSTKIQLGASLTEGLGAGANPEVGARAAQESKDEINNILSTQTKMIFITAGMGGGTGTGAAPVIAQMAKALDILTVGIVTMPFQFEGRLRLEQAQKGLERIKETVDALIVINNNKLREVYGNLGFKAGFAKADEVLATAARGIAEVITHHYTQNIDLKDAKTVLTDSGTAIMGSASASGSNRAQEAIVKALDSPLLNDNKITGCKNVLLLIVSGSDEITIDEIGEINDYIQTEAGNHTNIIMGVGEDENLGNEVSVTVIATGFGQEQQNEISNTEAKKIIHTLEDEQKIVHDLSEEQVPEVALNSERLQDNLTPEPFDQALRAEEDHLIPMNDIVYDINVEVEEVFNGIHPEAEEETISMLEEEVPLIHNLEEEGEERSVLDPPDVLSNEIEEEVSQTEETSIFEPQFEDVIETVEEENTEQDPVDLNEAESVTLSEEEEFIFNEVTNPLFKMDVIDPELVEAESQILLDFELPLQEKTSSELIATDDSKEETSEVSKLVEEDFEAAALEIKFEIKSEQEQADDVHTSTEEELKSEGEDQINPFEQSIDKTIAAQTETRKAHLKAFNHQFSHQYQKVEDMEKEPAYKRKGLNLDDNLPEAPSRLSLDNDSNDDLQLRSNNSFLHDNVD
jgi:cell division protein FtsZ